MGRYVIGVDVGTGSARAGVVDALDGRIIASHSHPIKLFNPVTDYYQQSSSDLWEAVCESIKQSVNQARLIDSECVIEGLAFDATCSLVVIGENDEPLGVSPKSVKQSINQSINEVDQPINQTINDEDDPAQNIIVWMDHRAISEAQSINQTNHAVLKYVGQSISVEMQLPKLLWLKKHRNDTYKKAKKFFDLTDWLTYRATGVEARSLCTVGCKWTYAPLEDQSINQSDDIQSINQSDDSQSINQSINQSPKMGWSPSFFTLIGLEDHVADNFIRIGQSINQVQHNQSINQSNQSINQSIYPIGTAVGSGLTKTAAFEFGLPVNLPVGVGLIDAHAGALAMAGAPINQSINQSTDQSINQSSPTQSINQSNEDQSINQSNEDQSNRLILIAGTSSCHMFVTTDHIYIPGIWGPYYGAVFENGWLNEGGESCVGSLLDWLIDSSQYGVQVRKEAKSNNQSIHEYFYERLIDLAIKHHLSSLHYLTKDIHCLPYFHGNRSPHADPSLTGMFTGLTIDQSINQLYLSYLSIMQSLAYGTRHIITHASENGIKIDHLMACGGLSKSTLFVQTHADVINQSINLNRETDAMIIGSACVAATAAKIYPELKQATKHLTHIQKIVQPRKQMKIFHEQKYQVFLKMFQHQKEYREIMKIVD